MIKANKFSLILSIISLVVLTYVIFDYHNKTLPSKTPLKISVEEAKSRRFGLIIDGRTQEEREKLGYYPNSIPISLQRVKQEVPLLNSNKNTWILIYCNTGSRAAEAANMLYRMGYKNVRYINESYLSLMPGSS
jgi:rhodanese-related sulfurtransferase